ncbi:hypothetical protein [Rickettsia endosymbiont of Orchestes rusci]|uniref:hypothetical protein n=1 Tax=Rickettsia endosymbiont of Orchestes rusci TaxID=3066250 RepID=UPI00313B9C36
MKAQSSLTPSTTATVSNSKNDYQNILNKLAVNDPSFSNLDLSTFHLTQEQVQEIASKIQNNNFVGNVIWGTYPNSTMSLIENIENKIIQNNKQYQYYPNDFTHGLLSSHVYLDSKDKEKVLFKSDDPLAKYNSHLKNWYVHKVFTKVDNAGYYGTLYVNEQTKQAVLAHRGTTLELKDLFKGNSSIQTDIKGVLGKQIVAQQITSYVVSKEAIEYAKNNDYHLSITDKQILKGYSVNK